MTKSNLFRDVISKMMEAVTLDEKGQLKVLDEDSMSEADELLNQMVVETARDWWAQLESAEDSLADMADEISFTELNADPSHVGSPALDLDTDEGPESDMQDVATMESLLGKDDFDLSSIFEGFHEDEDDIGMDDGDDDFDDLMRGNDEEGLGDAGPMGDDDMDDDDMDMIGGNDDMDIGMDDDGMGGESDFDFDFLDDDDMDMGDDDMGDDMAGGEFDMGDDDMDMGDDDMDDDFSMDSDMDDDQNMIGEEEEEDEDHDEEEDA